MTLIRRLRAAAQGFKNPDRVVPPSTVNWVGRIHEEAEAWQDNTPRWDRIQEIARAALNQAGLSKGNMLEIGGRLNPRNTAFPEFQYHALDLEDAPGADVEVAVGDITNCPHIPDGSYDFIFSLDVFEHIDKPWLAAQEIQRLLKPGGVTVHSTLFSWRYHPCPIDYWRYSAEGLRSLFDGLDCVHADFDYSERRRDLRGRDGNRMEIDALGGWRENVRVNFAGIKPIRPAAPPADAAGRSEAGPAESSPPTGPSRKGAGAGKSGKQAGGAGARRKNAAGGAAKGKVNQAGAPTAAKDQGKRAAAKSDTPEKE